MGYVAAFAFIVLLGIGIYSFGYAAKKTSLLFVLLLETILGLLIIFPLLITVDKLSVYQIFNNPDLYNWLWLGAAAIFGFVGGNYFSLLNLRLAGEKNNSLLSPAITALTIVLSFFFLKEPITSLQWLGICITLFIIAGFLLFQNAPTVEWPTWPGISGILTVVCIACAIICSIKGTGGKVSFLQAIWLRLFFALIIFATVYLIKKERLYFSIKNKKLYVVIFIGVICQTIVASYLWFYASFKIGISTFQIIVATLPLWMYLVDVYFIKRSIPSKIFLFTATVACLGICLVMF